MSTPVKLIAFSGSTRTGSHNQRLIELAAIGARAAGAEVEILSLRDFDLPLYDADYEKAQGIPPNAAKFKAKMVEADGYLISAPEFNGSLPGGLKNALDWASRPAPGEPEIALKAYRGKVAGIMSTSPGPWGGMRGLAHLRQILSGLQVLVVSEQLAVPLGHEAFNDDGTLKNPIYTAVIESIGKRAAQIGRALKDG